MKNLKKINARLFFSLILFGMIVITSSCSKDDSNDNSAAVCDTCARTADALAANDTSIKGIYKGIFVGSTGYISIDIKNNSNTITGKLVIDGTTVLLTADVAVVEGQSYVAPFTGTYNGSSISLTFSVGTGGGSPTITTSNIPGHPNAVLNLYKETSTSLIEAFESTYTQPNQTGVFNVIVARSLSKWGGTSKNNANGQTNPVSGTISNNELNLDGTIIGTINGDALNGSFKNGNNDTVTIKGKRTL